MNQAGNLVIAHAYHGAIWLYDPRGGVDNKTSILLRHCCVGALRDRARDLAYRLTMDVFSRLAVQPARKRRDDPPPLLDLFPTVSAEHH
jgi:hypothetical protein